LLPRQARESCTYGGWDIATERLGVERSQPLGMNDGVARKVFITVETPGSTTAWRNALPASIWTSACSLSAGGRQVAAYRAQQSIDESVTLGLDSRMRLVVLHHFAMFGFNSPDPDGFHSAAARRFFPSGGSPCPAVAPARREGGREADCESPLPAPAAALK